jgi:hypothetical protein
MSTTPHTTEAVKAEHVLTRFESSTRLRVQHFEAAGVSRIREFEQGTFPDVVSEVVLPFLEMHRHEGFKFIGQKTVEGENSLHVPIQIRFVS